MFALEKPVCREKTRLTGLEAPDVAASKAWRDSGRAPSLSPPKRREKGILLGSFYVSVKLPTYFVFIRIFVALNFTFFL